ncbi:ABC transporter substrate-binding protein [Clostridium septicum]|uniref:Spermidine/putrescine ABC transporter substrate-binding protein n=1 Tax=Clostridium septicum TaxID=1504 RepID=A0A9N7JK51_CLOSE|nr:spermidine/putrescine ABC transporter substrate-binding protein [Clostridium septicum]AYE33530.1 spermidine/putrescine ABC transporter substrate-binding protein [Clostridium septicum]MDU1313803.1 spermidine/putrescine ABC transporter substrate-binding protein [Clostridium septicum]QAS61693.1 spermidine/putrescine ABC transporter substrate-binding protein [Clostridium septicum]UEC21861.1 spermidine/putrescine ABC transporter substrate-binding protein [Clostridium septicum]USS00086.1 spermidi
MRKTIKITSFMCVFVLMVSLFTGCSSKEKKKTINILNYGENIADGLLKEFEQQYNIKVNEVTFDTMEKMYIELTSGKTKWDAVLVSDYMADRVIQEGLIQKINKNNIPNLKSMNEGDMGRSYDPNNEYTVPYMNGTIGIIYNKDIVTEQVDSWDIMWNPEYKNEIFVLDSPRDAIGMALKKLGYSLNSTNPKELEEAKKLLIEQKELGTIYGADEVQDLMISGERAVAMIWSGEGLNLADEHENLEYVVPKEGANYWLDSWAIPVDANDKEAAEIFINFVSEKDNALKIADQIGYTTPQKQAMEAQPEEVRNNPGAYMPKEVTDKCEVYKYFSQEDLKLYENIWLEVMTHKVDKQ